MINLRKIIWKNYLMIEKWILPNRENPQDIYKSGIEKNLNSDTHWLDLGCGSRLFPFSLPNSIEQQHEMVQGCKLVCGIDGDYTSLRHNNIIRNKVFGDIFHLPFSNNVFDLVTANMVVEHVENPMVLLAEVNRVLKPGGVFIVHTPNSKSYKIALARIFPDKLKGIIIKFAQNRIEGEMYPAYYRINTVEKQLQMARSNGFELLEYHMLQGQAESVLLGPLALIELILMRILSHDIYSDYRSNIVSVLKK